MFELVGHESMMRLDPTLRSLVPGKGTFQPLSRAKRGVRLRASNQLAVDRRLYRAKYIVQMTLDAFQRAPAPRG